MDSYRTVTPESVKTAGRVLFHAKTTSGAAEVGIRPNKSEMVYIVAIATMGAGSDLPMSVRTADDAAGLNTTVLSQNIPVFVNDVKQTAAKGYTITSATGTFVVVFCVPTIIVPATKYVGLRYEDSSVLNVLSAIAFEDSLYNG